MDSSIKFWKAIDNLKKGTEYKFSGDVPLTEELFNKINWKKDDGTFTTTNPHSELTWSKVDTEIKRLQTEYDNNDYQRNRKAEYPSIADQLDDIYHNGIDGWKATIKTTKDKYPKE
jgi:predicted lipoprotein